MHVLAFLLVAIVVVLTPGVDTALVTKNALLHGRAAAVASALGVNLGVAFWTVAAAVGLAAIVAASAAAFAVIKLVGCAYLIYLGIQALRASRRAGEGGQRVGTAEQALPRAAALRQGIVSNLLNPKIAVFFTSLLPQFAGTHGPIAARLLLLGGLFNCLGLAWLVSYAVLAARGRDLLSRPRVQRVLQRISALVLIALGVRLALEHRR